MKWTAENQVKAGVAGGIETIVNVIATHTNSIDVYIKGCSALWSMTANNGFKKKVTV